MQEWKKEKESASVNLPPLITRSAQEFVEDNLTVGSVADGPGPGPPNTGSIKADSWPADPAPINDAYIAATALVHGLATRLAG